MAAVKESDTVDNVTGKSADFDGSAFGFSGHTGLVAYLDITTAGGTNPTLDAKLQTKDPESGNWVDTGDSFSQQTATGTSILQISKDALGTTLRFSYTIGGTNPNFDFTMAVVRQREAP